MAAVRLRRARPADADAIWAIWQAVVARGDSYAFDPATPRAEALAAWMQRSAACIVAEDERGRIVGTYYLKPNQAGPGGHVANAGFMVDERARARGVGRAMGEHCLELARTLGFRSMQFNMVVATNEHAVGLWRSLGFAIVGTLPEAFRHPERGFVDAYVMYRQL
jgi:L-amino acid N-acyltransferase YncA